MRLDPILFVLAGVCSQLAALLAWFAGAGAAGTCLAFVLASLCVFTLPVIGGLRRSRRSRACRSRNSLNP